MKQAVIITLLLIIAGGLGFLGYQFYEERQQEQERIARIEREERREREEERRRRAQPCYGISLDNSWTTKRGALFTRTEKLYVRLSNSSERPKFVTIAFKMNGYGKSKRVKVYNNDTVETMLHEQGYDVSCSNCGYSEVRVSSCQ